MESDILTAAPAILAYMMIWFAAALIKKNNAIVDIAWGLGFVMVAALMWIKAFRPGFRPVLVTLLVLIWGVRLAWHIAVRNRGKGEDPRYAAWRREWGRHFIVRSLFQIFLLQGSLMLIIAFPVLLALQPGPAFSPLDGLGAGIWIFGFLFEAAGDRQLARFKRDPENRGRVMTEGLWRYTRHPNYFGESAMWWGIFLIAAQVPMGWTGVISPVVLTFLLLRVSGVPLIEKTKKKNPEFADYIRRTPAFFPWFPKNH